MSENLICCMKEVHFLLCVCSNMNLLPVFSCDCVKSQAFATLRMLAEWISLFLTSLSFICTILN